MIRRTIWGRAGTLGREQQLLQDHRSCSASVHLQPLRTWRSGTAGWQRMALQILYFVPHNLLQPARSFAAVSQKLLVSPVLKKLVFSNSPEEVRPPAFTCPINSPPWLQR